MFSDYPELKTILQQNESLHHPALQLDKATNRCLHHVYQCQPSAPHHLLHACQYQSRQPMVNTAPSVLSNHSNYASDLRNGPTREVSDVSLSQLMAQH